MDYNCRQADLARPAARSHLRDKYAEPPNYRTVRIALLLVVDPRLLVTVTAKAVPLSSWLLAGSGKSDRWRQLQLYLPAEPKSREAGWR